ncbi:MAG: hypothetical protein WA634_01155 [Silvibacterium sp.]
MRAGSATNGRGHAKHNAWTASPGLIAHPYTAAPRIEGAQRAHQESLS